MEFEDGASNNSTDNSTRFVLLLHALPDGSPQATHWDLMIHQADSLLTLALQALPPQTPQSKTSRSADLLWPATRLADHRLRYLDYEGVVGPAQPGGPDRGNVRRVAAGWAVCEVVQRPHELHRWRLNSPELQAVFAYTPCLVGQAMQLHIELWDAAL